MSGFVGADVEQITQLAQRLDAQAQKFREIAASSTAAIMVAEWTGAKIDGLRSEWNRQAKPTMLKMALALSAMAGELRKQAADQRETSASRTSPANHPKSAVDASSAVGQQAPATTADRWAVTRAAGEDGLRIQGVRGADGVTRYVVYIDGTNPDVFFGRNGIAENAALFGQLTATNLLIQAEMNRVIPPGAEVMVIGYSQGGIHGQLLAESGKYNITDLVTFGSPYASNPDSTDAANVVRIQDSRDPIPIPGLINRVRDLVVDPVEEVLDKVGTAWRSILGDDEGAVRHEVDRINRGQHFEVTTQSDVPDGDWGTHTDSRTYKQGAEQFDIQAADSREGRIILESQARYSGVVVSDTDV